MHARLICEVPLAAMVRGAVSVLPSDNADEVVELLALRVASRREARSPWLGWGSDDRARSVDQASDAVVPARDRHAPQRTLAVRDAVSVSVCVKRRRCVAPGALRA